MDSPDDALDVAHRNQQLGGTFLKHRTGWERYQRRWIMEATCNRPLCSFLLRLMWLCRSAAERLQRSSRGTSPSPAPSFEGAGAVRRPARTSPYLARTSVV